MNQISKNAVVSPKAKLGDNITIKDFAVIEDGASIGDNTVIGTNAIVHGGTTIAANCKIYHSAVLGAEPQDLKYKGEPTTLEIGEGTIISEFAPSAAAQLTGAKLLSARTAS